MRELSEMKKNIMCISCKYATVDQDACEGSWIAYECSNSESEYHKALVNVGANGEKNKRISWSGCEHGVRRQKDAGEGLLEEGLQDGNADKEQTRAN